MADERGDAVVHLANLGDSRAIVGEVRGSKVIAYPLSADHTPFRRDERQRLRASGALVMTRQMASGVVRSEPGWDARLTSELSAAVDPPLVYAPGQKCAPPVTPHARACLHAPPPSQQRL